jgi:hypothetical protein
VPFAVNVTALTLCARNGLNFFNSVTDTSEAKRAVIAAARLFGNIEERQWKTPPLYDEQQSSRAII